MGTDRAVLTPGAYELTMAGADGARGSDIR